MKFNGTYYYDTIEDWGDFNTIRNNYWIYRGEKNSEWLLRSSLERTCKRLEGTLGNIKKYEQWIIREFRRRYFQYRSHIRNEYDYLEWLSIMQHFGAPTRLLDFTYSIYIALYFALECMDEEEYSAVWCINPKWCLKESALLFGKGTEEFQYILAEADEKDYSVFKRTFFADKPKLFACSVNPFRLNERLTLQQGVFMCPGTVEKSFHENLFSLTGSDDASNLIKLHVPRKLKPEFMKCLKEMNINRATLFPGLEGFAKNLQVYIPTVMEDIY